jgi:hypothetical protein
MKKLGTPIAAGPGSESEKVGFDAFGTPLPVGPLAAEFFDLPGAAPAFFFFLWCFLPFLWVAVVEPGLWVDFCWVVLGLVGLGVVELLLLLVVVELELELELLELEDELELEVELVELELLELEELGLEVVEVVVEVVEVGLAVVELVAGGQDQATLATAPVIPSCESGVPGRTLSIVRVTPPTSVTVTVQGPSAEAVGSAAVAEATRIAAVSASTPHSFRLLNNVGQFLPETNVMRSFL